MFPFAVDPVFTPSEGERIARDFFPFPIVFLYLSPLSASKIDFQFRKFIIHNFHASIISSIEFGFFHSFFHRWRVIFLGAATNSIRRVDSSWKGWHSMGRRGVALSGRSRAIERSVRKKKERCWGERAKVNLNSSRGLHGERGEGGRRYRVLFTPSSLFQPSLLLPSLLLFFLALSSPLFLSSV